MRKKSLLFASFSLGCELKESGGACPKGFARGARCFGLIGKHVIAERNGIEPQSKLLSNLSFDSVSLHRKPGMFFCNGEPEAWRLFAVVADTKQQKVVAEPF